MDKLEVMIDFKTFVMEHGLPQTEMALFGIKCPYCGKSDRIRQLESPDELNGNVTPSELEHYRTLWHSLVAPDVSLGFCRFCLNPLKLDLAEGRAEPLID
jgi:hypothetical protein